jgi:adenosylcobyric acid synthase
MRRQTRTLVVWGCTSGAGKSWLVTALCRVAARRGLNVAPFKAQNMSNNARVVPAPDGGYGEIGAAQYLQALAARTQPQVDMNPVLLKPESDRSSQVVVQGRVRPEWSAMGWRERSGLLAQAARHSFEALAAQHELLIVEGAGSPAEINLAAHDYVNLDTARWACRAGPTRALLVANIDQGGAFAHLYGTAQLLPADLRPVLAGHVLNMFGGDPALLAPGPQQLQALTGVPVVAVLPRLADHGLPEEDGWFHPSAAQQPVRPGLRRAVVVAYPRISNLDEFAPLARVPGWQLVWARTAADLADAELVILPGSKQVSGDLQWLRERGLDEALQAHVAAGRRLLAVCGGLQMLGRCLSDPLGHDGQPGTVQGLGLMALNTRYAPDKRLRLGRFELAGLAAPWQQLSGLQLRGYEIRQGVTTVDEGLAAEPLAALPRVAMTDASGEAIGWQQGSVLGLYAHGLFESDELLRACLDTPAAPGLEATFETLADHVETHFDEGTLAALMGT